MKIGIPLSSCTDKFRKRKYFFHIFALTSNKAEWSLRMELQEKAEDKGERFIGKLI